MARWGFLCLLLLGSALLCAAGDCNDHGTLVDGKCQCTSTVPSATPGWGWVGDTCDIKVLAAAPTVSGPAADAAELLEPLQASQTVCFYTELVAARLVDVGLRLQAKDGAALDLSGLLLAPDDKRYPNADTRSSFVISTTPSRSYISYYLDKQSHSEYGALYSCITNKGTENATFSLRLAEDQCTFTLASDGNKTACSGHGTCEAGSCVCSAEWARPQAPVYAGLGFEQCSAASVALPDGSVPKQHLDMQIYGTWYFYNFTVSAASADRHITAQLTATANTTSDVELYLKYWQAPGRSVGQYDLRSDPGDFRRVATSADLSSSIHLGSGDAAYRTGVWFLGVFVNGNECAAYDLQLTRSACPNDCSASSGRGTCDPDSGVCTCKDNFAGEDCSQTHTQLQLGQSYTSDPRAGFTHDILEVPVGDSLSKAPGHSLSLVVQASFKSGSPLPAWVTARPMLLVSGIADASISTAALRTVLQEAETGYTLTLEASQVPGNSVYITLYNPINAPYEIGYTVSASTTASCINSCSGHGTCGAADGVCACEAGFAGPDCSVDVNAIKESLPCLEGTLREQAGWQGANSRGYAVCVCSAPDKCAYTDQAYVICGSGFTVTGANPTGIKLSDGRTIPEGGTCKKSRVGTSGGMVFFYCLLSIALFCGLVVGSKFGLERYQIWRANQVGGYNELGTSERASLWDAFTGSRRTQNQNDSW